MERPQQPVGAFHQHDPARSRRQLGEVVAQHHFEQLGQRAGVLHAGRPAAHDHEGEPLRPLGRIGGLRRPLQARQDVVAEPHRLVERLHADGPLGQLGVSEVGVGAAGRQHQGVVGDRVAAGHREPAGVEVDGGDSGLAEADVAGAAEHRPERVGDVGRVEQRGGHLVQQRREQVVVAGVEQEDVDVRAVERPGAGQAAEAAADDDHSLPPRHRHQPPSWQNGGVRRDLRSFSTPVCRK